MKKLIRFFASTCLAFTQFGFAEDSFTHEFVESMYPNHKIELMLQKPNNQRFHAILFLHGAQDTGLKSISPIHLNYWVEKGYAVAAVSMPGFGQSTGEKDFCGSFTMDSLNQAIDWIKNELGVSKFAIIGFGQGGIAATLLSAQRRDIICVICSMEGMTYLDIKLKVTHYLVLWKRKVIN